MDADPHSGELPGSQVMIDGLPLGEVARQHAPLDSPLRHIKDGIEHRSHTQGARASTAFGGGDQIFDPLPFLVSQVAWIDFFVHLPIVPTYEDFSDRLSYKNSAACRCARPRYSSSPVGRSAMARSRAKGTSVPMTAAVWSKCLSSGGRGSMRAASTACTVEGTCRSFRGLAR